MRWWRLSVSAVYVGVENLEAFAGELAALGLPGEDARRG
jgi:hypothetical protein